MRIHVLNGVNLDILGRRDPGLYGGLSIAELESRIYGWARELELIVSCRQTNSESEYVHWCHDAYETVDGLVVNPAAWTHYAWAIRDALEITAVPALEIHLSDPLAREPWRHVSVIGELCFASVRGLGPDGYRRGLELMREHLEEAGA